jgi:hypothetical protein
VAGCHASSGICILAANPEYFVTAARILLEIHRRAAAAPQDVPRRAALEQATREVLQLGADELVDVERLEALSPEALLHIDALSRNGSNTLRAVLVRPRGN